MGLFAISLVEAWDESVVEKANDDLLLRYHVIQKKEQDKFIDLSDHDYVSMTLRFIEYSNQSYEVKKPNFKLAKVKVTYKNLKSFVIPHDNNVDVVAINLHDLFEALYKSDILKGYMPYYYGIEMNGDLKSDLREFKTGGEVFLFGYPHGIFDEINYLPIGRFGHCSCNPQVQKERFLVDIASFPGQSGAPVFFKKSSFRKLPDDRLIIGSTTVLAGIFTSGYDTGQPFHLGQVIKVEYLQNLIYQYYKSINIIYSLT